jgi:hypothetical protein
MDERLKKLLEGVERWSEPEQAELVDILEQIEIRHSGEYHASREELQALDEAERSGMASQQQSKQPSKPSVDEGRYTNQAVADLLKISADSRAAFGEAAAAQLESRIRAIVNHIAERPDIAP